MSDGFNETPVRGKHTHNAQTPDGTAVNALVALAGNTAPTYTEGNVVLLSTDLAGRLRVALVDPDGSAPDVDVTDRAGRQVGIVSLDAASLAALESIDLNAATLAALESIDLNAATRDDIVGRLVTSITNLRDTLSTNLESVDLNAATLAALESVDLNAATRDDIVTRITSAITTQTTTLSANLESVDLNAATLNTLTTTPQPLSVRGSAVADTNPLPVMLQENPGATVDSGILEAVDVAPGASSALTGAVVGTGLTAKLIEVTISSSVRVKAVLRSMGTGAVDRRVFFVKEGESFTYSPKDRDLITAAGATGAFRLTVTNMDNLRTASIYASVSQVEV